MTFKNFTRGVLLLWCASMLLASEALYLDWPSEVRFYICLVGFLLGVLGSALYVNDSPRTVILGADAFLWMIVANFAAFQGIVMPRIGSIVGILLVTGLVGYAFWVVWRARQQRTRQSR